ncbi:MAG: hypothetical protein NTV06_02965, partial [candidate division Zixibacteria bacterium]|nr:hypothetical protein [candidate division Zixibacteria bacterium]
MKKWFLVMLLILPLNLVGQGLNGKMLGFWLGGEYCRIDFQNPNTPGDWGFRSKPGAGLSVRFPVNGPDLCVDLGGFASGRNSSKYEVTANLLNFVNKDLYLFGGGNYTWWSLTGDQKSDPGIGLQLGLGTALGNSEKDHIFIEMGAKLNTGKIKNSDNGFTAI